MQEFLKIAGTDFTETFQGAWMFPLLLLCTAWILWQEKDKGRKIFIGLMPLVFLFLYWCPLSGILFMKALGENVYWRILWLIPLAVTIPYAACLVIGKFCGPARAAVFFLCMGAIVLCGKNVLSEEWFEPSTNAYKIPQNVVEVCELLPGNVHVLASNRLMPYIRLYDTTVTLEYGRSALGYNGMADPEHEEEIIYLEAQKPKLDLSVLAPLAKKRGCTFLIFSASRTWDGRWEDYGYREYASTDEFLIFVDEDYKEGEDTRKWEG